MSKKEIKKEIAETQKAYKNLYTIFDLDDDGHKNKNDNLNIIIYNIFIDINSKKGLKLNKTKEKAIIHNKSYKNNYDIYSINNFYSNTVKIKEKSISINVQVPKYEELDDSFFEDNNIEVRIIVN